MLGKLHKNHNRKNNITIGMIGRKSSDVTCDYGHVLPRPSILTSAFINSYGKRGHNVFRPHVPDTYRITYGSMHVLHF